MLPVTLAALNDEREAEEKRRREYREEIAKMTRHIGGYAGSVVIVGVFVGCIWAGAVHGRAVWATAVSIVVFLATAAWAWGEHKTWKTPFTAVILAGALSVLWVNLFGVLPNSKPAKHPVQTRPRLADTVLGVPPVVPVVTVVDSVTTITRERIEIDIKPEQPSGRPR